VSEPLLRVRGLTCRHGPGCPSCADAEPGDETNRCPRCRTVFACRDVSFDLFPGEALGIMGESGSGKSTLVKLLHFEQEATSGDVRLHAQAAGQRVPELFANGPVSPNLLGLSSYQRRRIRSQLVGVVHQNPHLGLRMAVSAGGNVVERLLEAGWRNLAAMRARAEELFARTEVPVNRMDEPPRNFSGGMQQRVQIAKALSNDPALLLLDEMTTGLDLSVQARVLDLVRNLHAQLRVAMLVVSHDLGVIGHLCQRTLVMRHGKVVEAGLTDQIIQDPQHPYTQLLVSSQL
jgi:putative phosphonate transport system ATP-binding protein